MKKTLTILGLLFAATVVLFAQATHISTSGTLPIHCTQGDIYHKTGTSAGLYDCSATDTWTGPFSAGAGSVTPTGSPASGNLAKFSGASTISNVDLSGDVSTSGTAVTTIANGVVTLAKIQNASANSRFLGSGSSGSGASYTEMTPTTATALLNAMVGDSGSGGTKGLVPAPASGDAAAGKFLKADGTFAVPSGGGGGGGGGGLVLLEEHTASSSATLDFTTRNVTGQSGATFQSDFDEYQVELVGVMPATNAVDMWLRMGTGAGPSWDAGTNYAYEQFLWRAAATGVNGGTAQNQIILQFSCCPDHISTATAGFPLIGHLRLWTPLDTTLFKMVEGVISYKESGSGLRVSNNLRGAYESSTAITGIRFLMSSGNIASGTIRIYGIAK